MTYKANMVVNLVQPELVAIGSVNQYPVGSPITGLCRHFNKITNYFLKFDAAVRVALNFVV